MKSAYALGLLVLVVTSGCTTVAGSSVSEDSAATESDFAVAKRYAVSNAKHFSRSHETVIRAYDCFV